MYMQAKEDSLKHGDQRNHSDSSGISTMVMFLLVIFLANFYVQQNYHQNLY